jgi:uncharacterized FlaG/YvyC family protein
MGTEIESVIRAGPADMSLSHFQAGSSTARSTEKAEARAPEAQNGEKPPAEAQAPSAQLMAGQDNVGLVFQLSKDGKELVIKIVDRTNDRVLREIPPEELQHFRSTVRDLIGLLVDRKG